MKKITDDRLNELIFLGETPTESEIGKMLSELLALRTSRRLHQRYALAHEVFCPRNDDKECNCGLDNLLANEEAVVNETIERNNK